MRRLLAIVLCILIAVLALAGCGSKNENGSKEGRASGAQVPDYMNATGFPITKDKVTVKMMAAKNALQGPWESMTLMKKLAGLTNIDFIYDTTIESSYAEKKNLTLASGDFPDVFFRGLLTQLDEETYGTQGALIPLEGLINQYAPNLKKLLETDADVKRSITALDGHIYTLPYVVQTKTMAGGVLWINMNWLDKVGMKMPETTDDFYSVLKAFKEKDPNSNGKPDEIPISSVKMPMLNSTILCAFGDVSGGSFDLKNNKVIFGPMEAPYKEYLTYLNKLYTEGLLDNESFSQTIQQMTAKSKDGKVGVLTSSPASMLNPGKYDEHLIVPPLTSALNKEKMTMYTGGVLGIGTFAITDKCKYPEALIRWVDNFYADDENAAQGISGMTLWLGENGTDWSYSNAEKTVIKRESKDPALSPSEYTHKYVTPGGAGAIPAKLITNAIFEGDYWLAKKASESDEKYFPYMKKTFPQLARYTSAESERLATLETDVNTYVDMMTAKFIVGEEPLSKWDNYISTLKKMNIDEVIKIKQAAYDRWVNTK